MADEEETAQNDDDQTSGDSADADTTGSDATDDNVTGDDTSGSEGDGNDGTKNDGSSEGQEEADKTGDKEKQQMIPKDRFDEVIGERNAARERSERLQGQVEVLAQMIAKAQSGDRTTDKQQDKAQNALDTLIAAGEVRKEDAVKLQKLIDAMGYHRGEEKPDPRYEKLEKTVENLTKMLGDQADRKEKDAVLKQYGDLITEDDLDAVMKEWGNSRDAELKYAAQHWSYEKIVKLAFHEKIVANEVDKALKGKKPPAPKIDKKGGDKSPKKPQHDDFEWDPGNGEASMDALHRSILVDMAKDGE